MTDKPSSRSRPPTTTIRYKTQRSRSISNDLELAAKLLPVRRRERKISMITDTDTLVKVEKTSRVNALIKKFEKMTPAENTQSNIENKNLLTPLDRCPSAPTTSVSIRTQKIVLPRKQISIGEESTVIKSIHNPPDSLAHGKHSIQTDVRTTSGITPPSDYVDSPTVKPETIVPPFLMTESVERPHAPMGIFILSQPDYINDDTDTSCISSPVDEDEDMDVKRKSQLFERLKGIIKEVHTTEETYVRKLYILSVKIPSQIKESCEKDENLIKTFNNTYKPVLTAIQNLYSFHHDIILPHIEQYITEHRKENMWSIFQEHYQVIEDLYKAYYVAYDESQKQLDSLCTSNPSISQAMLKCRVYFDNLYPIDELNCANQRLLRYMLLMKTYMKQLDENLPEFKHTRFIHDELTRIAERCEEYLAVSSSQLNKLKDRVDNKPDCFDNQKLIWHGSVKKQSPRIRTNVAQRYLILFSNCLLVYKESGNKLEIKLPKLSIKDIIVDVLESRPLEPPTTGQQNNITNYYPFRVHAVERSYEFLVDKELDREKWVNKIRQTSEELKNGNSPIASKNNISIFNHILDFNSVRLSSPHATEEQYGHRAPAWISDIDVSRCQICHNRFKTNIILSRRHHCRSCGRCICGSCSTRKLMLPYCAKAGEQRICDSCYTYFTGLKKSAPSSQNITRDPNKTILFGDFYCASSKSILWIDLTEDFQLYIYQAKLDRIAEFSINLPDIRKISFIKETQTFTLFSKDKTYKLSLELNHQLSYQKNDYIDETIKNTSDKTLYYANLWHDTMQMAHKKTLPSWYIRKRDSADSGISDNL